MTDFEELKARIRSLDASKSERGYWRLAHDIEAALLYLDQFPEGAFSVFAVVFGDGQVASRKGVCHFANILQSDFYKLSPTQAGRLLDLFLVNASAYRDELTRHCIADLVARHYPEEESLRFFRALANLHSLEGEHMCAVGCDIILRRDATSGAAKNAARELLAKLKLQR